MKPHPAVKRMPQPVRVPLRRNGDGEIPLERSCSVGRTIGILSDAWAFLIIRECFFGARRFDQFQALLQLPRATLTERLRTLTEQGILRKVEYLKRPLRYEYRLSEQGIDLYPSMIAMLRFGDRWLSGQQKVPLRLIHQACGCTCQPYVACSACMKDVKAREVTFRDGPGAGLSPVDDTRRRRRASDSSQFDRGRPSSVSRLLQIIGDRWTFLIIRETFLGVCRFDDIQTRLRIAPNILTDRLNRLVVQGLYERRLYQRLPDRFEYRLTEMGLDLYGPFITIMRWGDRWLSNGKPPLILTHKVCGEDFTAVLLCNHCRKPIVAWEMGYKKNYEIKETGEVRMRRT